MKQYRLNRVFNAKSSRCFDVGWIEAYSINRASLSGIEDMRKWCARWWMQRWDAIQLTPGMARHLQEIPGRFKPSLVLRTDVAKIYGKELPASRFSLTSQFGYRCQWYRCRTQGHENRSLKAGPIARHSVLSTRSGKVN